MEDKDKDKLKTKQGKEKYKDNHNDIIKEKDEDLRWHRRGIKWIN